MLRKDQKWNAHTLERLKGNAEFTALAGTNVDRFGCSSVPNRLLGLLF